MSERPQWVPEDWLLYSRGYDLGGEVPEGVQGAFDHSDPWIRVVAITMAAMSGDLSRVDDLFDVASSTDDLHLADCALRVFAQAASPSKVGRLAVFFDHPEFDVRVTAYQGAMMSAHLPLVRTLAASREGKDDAERSLIEVRISTMLEGIEDGDFIVEEDAIITNQAYQEKVNRRVQDLQVRHGMDQAVHFGAPLDVFALSQAIREFLDEDDPSEWGGAISDLLDTLAGMIGLNVVGCMDDDVEPVVPKIKEILADLRRDPKLLKVQNGKRSFFCHPVG